MAITLENFCLLNLITEGSGMVTLVPTGSSLLSSNTTYQWSYLGRTLLGNLLLTMSALWTFPLCAIMITSPKPAFFLFLGSLMQ